jgi:hypothetical protein
MHSRQIVSNTNVFRRAYNNGSWTAWDKHQLSQAEQDARYQQIIAAGTTAQFWRGDKTWQTLNASAVGLGNVNNTSDASKPVSTATAAAISAVAQPAITLPEPTGGDDIPMIDAIAAANPGVALSFRSFKNYKFNSVLNVTGSVYGNFAKIDTSGMAAGTALGQRFAIRASGSLDTARTVTTAVALKSRVIAGLRSTTGILAGDMVLIINDESPGAASRPR